MHFGFGWQKMAEVLTTATRMVVLVKYRPVLLVEVVGILGGKESIPSKPDHWWKQFSKSNPLGKKTW